MGIKKYFDWQIHTTRLLSKVVIACCGLSANRQYSAVPFLLAFNYEYIWYPIMGECFNPLAKPFASVTYARNSNCICGKWQQQQREGCVIKYFYSLKFFVWFLFFFAFCFLLQRNRINDNLACCKSCCWFSVFCGIGTIGIPRRNSLSASTTASFSSYSFCASTYVSTLYMRHATYCNCI